MATSAKRIRIPHPDLSLGQRSYISSDYSSGVTLNIDSNTGFAIDTIAVVGEPGAEKTEQKDVDALVSTTGLTLSAALIYAHNKSTIVYASQYDQVEISYNDQTNGWAVLVTQSIQWDQRDTIYNHIGGLDAYDYRFRFKNSASGNFSEYSPTIAGTGYAKNSVGQMLANVRRIINDPGAKKVSDIEIVRFLTRAKDIIRGRRSDWWFWRASGTMPTITDTYIYDLDTISTKIDYIKDVRYRYISGNTDQTYPIDHQSDLVFDALSSDNNRTSDDNAEFYNIQPPDDDSASGYLRVFPTSASAACSFLVRYYEDEGDFTSVSDITKVPIPGILEDFAIAQCERIKGDEVKAQLYLRMFYGPGEDERDNVKEMTGIALLEQMQGGKGRPVKRPRQLKRYYGRAAISHLYNGRRGTGDSRRIDYW